MTSLTQIIAAAKAEIHNSTSTSAIQISSSFRGSSNAAGRDIAGIVPGAIRNIINPITAGTQQAISGALRGVNQAASQAMHGDFSGALSSLASTPQSLINTLSSTFGLSRGGTLRGPGPQGASPGNSLAGAIARGDPQLSFCWYAIMPDVTPIGGTPESLPWYFVEEANPPFRTFETRSIFHEGHNKHYPSTYSVDSLRLALYADSTNVAMNYLQAWNGALLAPTTAANAEAASGLYGRPVSSAGTTGYKKTIQIFLINPAKERLVKLEYIGCWPQSVDAYSLDSASSTRVINHVTFSVDDVFTTLYAISDKAFNILAG